MSKVVNDTYDHVNGALMTIADILALLEKMDGNKDGKLLKILVMMNTVLLPVWMMPFMEELSRKWKSRESHFLPMM